VSTIAVIAVVVSLTVARSVLAVCEARVDMARIREGRLAAEARARLAEAKAKEPGQ
jgi:hypothetical protein